MTRNHPTPERPMTSTRRRMSAAVLLAKIACLATAMGVAAPVAVAAPVHVATEESTFGVVDGTARFVLKDKRVIEGSIQREVNGYYWIKATIGNIEQEMVLSPDQIESVEKLSGDAPVVAAATSSDPIATTKPLTSGTPRAVILTLGEQPGRDMVGLFTAAKPLRDAIPVLEEEIGTDGSGVVVFRVRTYGGMVIEISKLHEVILKEFKPRFRTVGWVEIAISAGAATSTVLDELYFTTDGIYGAAVGFRSEGGVMKAMEGMSFEEFVYYMEKMSAAGGRAPEIFRAMQNTVPLSATIDENGDVKWFQDETTGKILVNPADKVLTFNAQQAVELKFARAIVDDYRDLPKAMGYQELTWVGKDVKGVSWPVSKAEEIQQRYRDRVNDDQTRTSAFLLDYQGSVEAARGAGEKRDRMKMVGRARQALDRIKGMVKNNPNFALTVFGELPEEWPTWVEQQEKTLRDLMR